MRESSSRTASTSQVQAKAKSLFAKILPASPFRSIFCPDFGGYPLAKALAISILERSQKKIVQGDIRSEFYKRGPALGAALPSIMHSKTILVLALAALMVAASLLCAQTNVPTQTTQDQGASEPVEKPGRGIKPPRTTYSPAAQYSEKARVAKYQGTCILKLVVGTDGHPRNIRVINPIGMGLDEKAVEAVRTWRFQPATKDGTPVAFEVAVEVSFHLYGIAPTKLEELTKRANAGDAQAQLDLAHTYLKGKQSPEDEELALNFLEKAANQGLPRAQFEMAEHIERQGASADYSKAYMWYTLAQRGGEKHSEKPLKKLTARMTPEQLQAGQTLVDNWKSVPANGASPK